MKIVGILLCCGGSFWLGLYYGRWLGREITDVLKAGPLSDSEVDVEHFRRLDPPLAPK